MTPGDPPPGGGPWFSMLPGWLARPLGLFFSDPRLLAKYISAGAVAAMLELLLFTLFYQQLGWPLLVANSSALAIAVLTGFTLQKNWTFGARGGANRQFRLYILMQCISALLNTGLITLMIAHWDWPPPLAKVIQIGLVFLWNFSFCRLVIFADSRNPSAG